MINLHTAIFSHRSDHWTTPQACMEALYAEFSLNFDPCPLHSTDGLTASWKGKRCFINPPYSLIPEFLAKHVEAEIAVYLLPSRTGTRWFHEVVLPKATEIRFLRGRLKFGGSVNNAPFDSLIAIFDLVRVP